MPIKHKRPELEQATTINGLQTTIENIGLSVDIQNAINRLKEYFLPVLEVHGSINVETGDIPELLLVQPATNPNSEWIENELEDLRYGRFGDVSGIELDMSADNWIDIAEIVVFGCTAVALETSMPSGLKATISSGYAEIVSWIHTSG